MDGNILIFTSFHLYYFCCYISPNPTSFYFFFHLSHSPTLLFSLSLLPFPFPLSASTIFTCPIITVLALSLRSNPTQTQVQILKVNWEPVLEGNLKYLSINTTFNTSMHYNYRQTYNTFWTTYMPQVVREWVPTVPPPINVRTRFFKYNFPITYLFMS